MSPIDQSQRTASVPVIVESVKDHPEFQMTRCIYFTIESDSPSPDWMLFLQGRRIPFLMVGMIGIVHAPIMPTPGDNESAIFLGDGEFESAEMIDSLFDAIEGPNSSAELTIDVEDIWLPNKLLPWVADSSNPAGMVCRVSWRLFDICYLYRCDQITTKQFLAQCGDTDEHVRLSERETDAFAQWTNDQIENAKADYTQEHLRERKRQQTDQGGTK